MDGSGNSLMNRIETSIGTMSKDNGRLPSIFSIIMTRQPI